MKIKSTEKHALLAVSSILYSIQVLLTVPPSLSNLLARQSQLLPGAKWVQYVVPQKTFGSASVSLLLLDPYTYRQSPAVLVLAITLNRYLSPSKLPGWALSFSRYSDLHLCVHGPTCLPAPPDHSQSSSSQIYPHTCPLAFCSGLCPLPP